MPDDTARLPAGGLPRSRPSRDAAPAFATLHGREVPLRPLARLICERYFAEYPHDLERYGDAAEPWCLHDNQWIVDWALTDLELTLEGRHFGTQLGWLAGLLRHRGFPLAQLRRNVEIAVEVLADALPEEAAGLVPIAQVGVEAVEAELSAA